MSLRLGEVSLSQPIRENALQKANVRWADLEFLCIKSLNPGRLLSAKMTFVPLHSHDFTCASYSEPPLGSLVGFHLRHDLILSPIRLSLLNLMVLFLAGR